MTFNRVLITGGAGFIGSNFVRYVLGRHGGWQVVVLDKLTYAGSLDNLAGLLGRITFVRGDIAEPADVAKAADGVDAIVNFAAESHVDRSLVDARPFVRTNVEGTLVLLEYARKSGVGRFVQVSTDEVYGQLSPTAPRSTESDALRPRNPYSATKAGAEALVLSYCASYGLNVVITRGSNTYGPYQCPEKIIPLFVTNALEGKPLPLYGRGLAVRDYLHVDDHCSGIDLVMHEGKMGGAYNIGADSQIAGTEVARRILAIMGRPASLIEFVPDRPGHDYRYSVDTALVRQLGWRPGVSWGRGLVQTVGWYVDNHAWWRRAKSLPAYRAHNSDWYASRLKD